MNTGNPCLKIVEEKAPRPQVSLGRDIAFALVVATILCTGAWASALSPQTATAHTAEVEVAKPSRETVHLPSQYVDQGRDIPDPAPTF